MGTSTVCNVGTIQHVMGRVRDWFAWYVVLSRLEVRSLDLVALGLYKLLLLLLSLYGRAGEAPSFCTEVSCYVRQVAPDESNSLTQNLRACKLIAYVLEWLE